MGASSGKEAPPVTLEDISSIKLTDLSNDTSISSSELWNNNPDECIVIYLVRRPGCPLCREQAATLTEITRRGLRGIRLVAVVHENSFPEDVAKFQEYFGRNKVYLDNSKGFFAALGSRTLGYEALMWPSVINAFRRAMGKNIEGTLSGEGRLLGGLLVATTERVWYQHKEEYFGDWPSNSDVVAAIESAARQSEVAFITPNLVSNWN